MELGSYPSLFFPPIVSIHQLSKGKAGLKALYSFAEGEATGSLENAASDLCVVSVCPILLCVYMEDRR